MTPRPRSSWTLLVSGLAAVLLSGAALAAVLFERRDGSPVSAAPQSTLIAPTLAKDTEGATLYYTGALPARLPPASFAPADATHPADLAFSIATSTIGFVTRYWVPVASVFAGVDSVTQAQLIPMLGRDDGFTWERAGGVGGQPRLAEVTVAEDTAWLGQIRQATYELRFRSYAELLAAMAVPGNGIFAWMPLEEVRPPAVPLAVDGMDLVRGVGNPEKWPYAERLLVFPLSDRGFAAAPGIEERLRAKLPVVTRVVATGDVLIARCTLARVRATGDWGAPLRSPVGQFLAAADLALTSLDASIQDIGEPYGCIGTTNLTSPPQVIEALKIAGIDEATVATNHVFDCGSGGCGSRGFLRMLDLLHEAGIKTVGGGANLDAAFAPAIFEVHGIRFGILGVDDIAAEDLEATDSAPGTAPMDDSYANERASLPREPAFYKPPELLGVERLQAKVAALKAQVDVVILQVQSGTEETHDPSPRSIKAERAAAAAGADLVIGNQAHWVQAIEMRGSSFIAYALGNFIFDQVHTPEFEQGYLVEATFLGKRLAAVRLLPYRIMDQYHPEFVDGAQRAKILRDVFEASARLP